MGICAHRTAENGKKEEKIVGVNFERERKKIDGEEWRVRMGVARAGRRPSASSPNWLLGNDAHTIFAQFYILVLNLLCNKYLYFYRYAKRYLYLIYTRLVSNFKLIIYG